ncbi:MAG TPA: COX15/CtaA family protein [Puia sp.]|uniref:COX15/CtaA family protein n=1 Tax=Puia sp. TaxID=2045100 RepID=UPI002CB0C449|nr:COX15/CtaA family protein [Puia sp.]HVU98763.1 COX15/CtaA family protein [Puia sp.]
MESSSNKRAGGSPAVGQTSKALIRPVAIWVYAGVIMLLIQVILGGITRLSGSGLSITEWNVVTGALPPLNSIQWQQTFDKYRQTPQFRLINSDFTLADFKFIFFWEWFHRLWARLVGVVFLVGFAGLLWKKKLQPAMIKPLIILFLLGALQGAVGWIMVASGLTGDAIYVAPLKLALHFVFAMGLIVYAFWFALDLSVAPGARLAGNNGATLRGWTWAILALLFFQLLYGALMAGHKAAAVAPTWPTINGSWIPDGLFSRRPLKQDLVGNTITVQFIHRGLAYILFVMVLVWTFLAFRIRNATAAFTRWRRLPLAIVTLQIGLGISSLLTSPGIIARQWVAFDWLALIHQTTGLLFLVTMVGMLYLVVSVRAGHSVTV